MDENPSEAMDAPIEEYIWRERLERLEFETVTELREIVQEPFFILCMNDTEFLQELLAHMERTAMITGLVARLAHWDERTTRKATAAALGHDLAKPWVLGPEHPRVSRDFIHSRRIFNMKDRVIVKSHPYLAMLLIHQYIDQPDLQSNFSQEEWEEIAEFIDAHHEIFRFPQKDLDGRERIAYLRDPLHDLFWQIEQDGHSYQEARDRLMVPMLIQIVDGFGALADNRSYQNGNHPYSPEEILRNRFTPGQIRSSVLASFAEHRRTIKTRSNPVSPTASGPIDGSSCLTGGAEGMTLDQIVADLCDTLHLLVEHTIAVYSRSQGMTMIRPESLQNREEQTQTLQEMKKAAWADWLNQAHRQRRALTIHYTPELYLRGGECDRAHLRLKCKDEMTLALLQVFHDKALRASGYTTG
ncbi:hypothetical protein AUK40_03930 [Candidatus Wirthbacteria bacterium CG2_30_54_11]|uniref:HD domain-containing protein n=1 Tax=Candidatus Wirthbacteria bacterium CG2_30_54_11 TaxID=1817892 RepID=A0A1J5J0W9_9BACT|nr:MAG: hypothetical protein AUK40_03930 [Candidatus Wirthbacteria bacterium CG2_30_54_11]